MKTFKWLSPIFLVILLGTLFLRAQAIAAPIETINIVQNSGFEMTDPLTGTGSLNWQPWWKEEPRPNDGTFNYAFLPKWDRESLSNGAAPELILAGNSSQRVYNNWDPWYGGVKQTMSAQAGALITFTANARLWASSDAWPNPSDPAVAVEVYVGLDPTGGDDPFTSTVRWSLPFSPHNLWQVITIEAIVGNQGQVTVFLATDYRGESRENLMVVWDDAQLLVPVNGHAYLPLLFYVKP